MKSDSMNLGNRNSGLLVTLNAHGHHVTCCLFQAWSRSATYKAMTGAGYRLKANGRILWDTQQTGELGLDR
jgi:hypothetical protein